MVIFIKSPDFLLLSSLYGLCEMTRNAANNAINSVNIYVYHKKPDAWWFVDRMGQTEKPEPKRISNKCRRWPIGSQIDESKYNSRSPYLSLKLHYSIAIYEIIFFVGYLYLINISCLYIYIYLQISCQISNILASGKWVDDRMRSNWRRMEFSIWNVLGNWIIIIIAISIYTFTIEIESEHRSEEFTMYDNNIKALYSRLW